MGMYGLLCSLSEERRMILEADPDLFAEVLLQERPVPGLLSLGKAWDALDRILSAEAPPLHNAVLARDGVEFGGNFGFGPPRLLDPDQVDAVDAALAALPENFVDLHYPDLAGQEVHGGFGSKPTPAPTGYEEELAALGLADEDPEDLVLLREVFGALVKFYRNASDRGSSIVAVIV